MKRNIRSTIEVLIHQYKTVAVLGIFLLIGVNNNLYAQKRQMVLVTKKNNVIDGVLTLKEVRLLYMGRLVAQSGQSWTPLLNTQDRLLHEAFLQKIIFMSDRYYHRYLLKRTFRSGLPSIQVLKDLKKWPENRKNTVFVSYMWQQDVNLEDFKIVMTLWQENPS